MNAPNFKALAEHYSSVSLKDLDDEVIHQAKRCLLDTIGCMFSAGGSQKKILDFISSLSTCSECGVPGTRLRMSAAAAAFAASVLASADEMDDATAIGASVHPGCCVIPAALISVERHGSTYEKLLLSIIFGYDLCNRLGLMATERIRELGLYGPGVIAAPCAATVAGFLAGSDIKKLFNSFSIALSMAPVCPFSAFTDGADCKLLYNGWGVYLGMLSADMASAGLTGPEHITRGGRSLQSIFRSDAGTDVPVNDSRYASAVVFKDYAACLSVHASLTAIEMLTAAHSIAPEHINRIDIATFPYACDLNGLTHKLNAVSARTSIPYTAAALLCRGDLDPDCFSDVARHDERILSLMAKVSVSCAKEYGAGPFGVRGSKVRIAMNDGSIYDAEALSGKWGKTSPPTDNDLIEKFTRITAKAINKERRHALINTIFESDPAGGADRLTNLLALDRFAQI